MLNECPIWLGILAPGGKFELSSANKVKSRALEKIVQEIDNPFRRILVLLRQQSSSPPPNLHY